MLTFSGSMYFTLYFRDKGSMNMYNMEQERPYEGRGFRIEPLSWTLSVWFSMPITFSWPKDLNSWPRVCVEPSANHYDVHPEP